MTDSETAAASGVSWEILLLERTLVVHVPLAVVLSSGRLLVGTGACMKPGALTPLQKQRQGSHRSLKEPPAPLPSKWQRRVEEILWAGDFVRRRALLAGHTECSWRGDHKVEDCIERGS